MERDRLAQEESNVIPQRVWNEEFGLLEHSGRFELDVFFHLSGQAGISGPVNLRELVTRFESEDLVSSKRPQESLLQDVFSHRS